MQGQCGGSGRLRRVKKFLSVGKVGSGIALCCAIAALFAVVVVATGQVGGPDSTSDVGPDFISGVGADSISGAGSDAPSRLVSDSPPDVSLNSPSGGGSHLVSVNERVLRGEALPCTGFKEPINFEIFSAGPSVAGVPLNSVQRRCGGSTPADEAPVNFTNYIYGHCEGAESDTGCAPPLEIQTWPACQRALGDYSFEGKPMPYRRLPSRDGAEVVEIDYLLESRIEVYSKSSTIVIFAGDLALAQKALALLRSQEMGKPPATQGEELKGEPEEGLEPPSDNAIEGELPCQS